MKKLKFFAFLVIASISTQAQNFDVSTSTLDLENYKLHKGWKNYGAYTKDGNIIVKYASAYCDADIKSEHYSRLTLTGDMKYISDIKATFKGVAYIFKELIFDKNLNFIKIEEKKFPTTADALKYQPNLFGSTFIPYYDKFFVNMNKNNPYGIIFHGVSEGAIMMPALTADYIGTSVVFPKLGFGIGKPNTKVESAFVYSIVTGDLRLNEDYLYTYVSGASCRETPVYGKYLEVNAQTKKGEYWYPATNVVFPNGGFIGFYTRNVVPDDGKIHVIFKKFNGELQESGQFLDIPFEYYPLLQSFSIRNGNNYDFVLITQQADKIYDPYLKKISREKIANKSEIIYIDGQTLKIKHRLSFELPFTDWNYISLAQGPKGELYFMGKCRKDNTTFKSSLGLVKDKKLINFQIMKFNNGIVEWVKGYDMNKDASKAKVITGEGVKGKKEMKIIFSKEINPKDDVLFLDDKLFIKGQVYQGQLYLAEFDATNGELKNYYIKPESITGKSDVIFSNDHKNLFWATYDFKRYNKYNKKTNVLTASKIKTMISGQLFLSKINLSEGSYTPFSLLGKDQWVVSYQDPLVLSETDADEIIFQGRTLARRAKDSELVLIKVKK
jgi:hypothetical protein